MYAERYNTRGQLSFIKRVGIHPCHGCSKPSARVIDIFLPTKWQLRRRFCYRCQRIMARESEQSRVADPAIKEYVTAQASAQRKVRYAIRVGKIRNPSEFNCVDCGREARVYDHRDYTKPFDVAPVCLSCNTKRGHATNPCWGRK